MKFQYLQLLLAKTTESIRVQIYINHLLHGFKYFYVADERHHCIIFSLLAPSADLRNYKAATNELLE